MGKTMGEAIARDDDGFKSVMAAGTCHGPRRDGDEMPQEQCEATAFDDDGFFDSVMATATWRENAVPTSSAGQPAPRNSADDSAQESAHPPPFKTLFELRHWLEHLPVADRRTVPVCRVCDALHVLELDPSRERPNASYELFRNPGVSNGDHPAKIGKFGICITAWWRQCLLKETDYEQWDDHWGRSANEQSLARCSATGLISLMQRAAVVSEVGLRGSETQAVMYNPHH